MDRTGKTNPGVLCRGIADENTSGSVATCIRHSASGLISDSFSRWSSTAIFSSNCFSEEGSKRGSVFASTDSSELDASSEFQSSQYSSIHVDQQRGLDGTREQEISQSWKTRRNNNPCQSAFEEFIFQESPPPQFQKEMYPLLESQVNTSGHDSSKLWEREVNPEERASSEFTSVWSYNCTPPAPDIYSDGAAVVAMLCDPEFSPGGDLESLARCPIEGFEDMRDRLSLVWPLADLREPFTAFDLSTVHFDSNANNAKLPIAAGRTSQGTPWMEPKRFCDMMTEGGKLLSWLKNFKSYQDEVWGPISYPAPRTREVKEAQGNGQKTVRKLGAIQRLGMIVRHINRTVTRK